MKDEIASWIPEKLFRLIEADAEKHQMTTAEAAACAIIDYYAGRELRKNIRTASRFRSARKPMPCIGN